MGEQKYLPGWGSIAILLSPALVIFSSLPVGLRAQPYPEWKVSLEFPVDNVGQPNGGSGGGGTRGQCFKYQQNQEDKMPLTGLMPIRNKLNQETSVATNQTLTVAANPTFFVYVPSTTTQSAEDLVFAEFSVYDDQDKDVYNTTFRLPTVLSSDLPNSSVSTPGILKLSLPTNVSLETGKTYRWVFQLYCSTANADPNFEPNYNNNPFVDGWIQRTELSPDLKTKIEQATPLEQAKLYAKERIWSETLMLAAQLRSSNPDEWEELLKSVGLNEIAQAPFIEYSTPEQ
jgi:hypothetical protein